MPKGPQGQKRPADANACAVMVAKIATGEITEPAESKKAAAGRLGGMKGGKAKAARLTKHQRTASAKKAANARWPRH